MQGSERGWSLEVRVWGCGWRGERGWGLGYTPSEAVLGLRAHTAGSRKVQGYLAHKKTPTP